METPTITKKQAKNTLSGKKKKPEVIKHVLTKPYNNYWPRLSPEDHKQLYDILTRFLPKLVLTKPTIPYSAIKSLPKEERKKFRMSFIKEPPVSPTDKKHVIFGVNDVNKLLEKQEAGCILVAQEVEPRILVQHILDQAVLYNVPLVVVSDLKEVCKSKCGIAGTVVAIHKSVPPESELGLIHQTVCNLHEKYPVGKNHIHSDRRLNVSTITIPDSEDDMGVISDEEEPKNYHLQKQSGKRAFVPSKVNTEVVTFINLDTDTSMNLGTPPPPKRVTTKNKGQYNALKVTRVRGNKNRNKRKMEQFKNHVVTVFLDSKAAHPLIQI